MQFNEPQQKENGKIGKIYIDLPSEISAPTGIYHRIHTRIDPSEPCNDHRHNFFVFNALYAEARQQIDNEKRQPAHDEHAHHDAQRFRGNDVGLPLCLVSQKIQENAPFKFRLVVQLILFECLLIADGNIYLCILERKFLRAEADVHLIHRELLVVSPFMCIFYALIRTHSNLFVPNGEQTNQQLDIT